jgi:hypothetical protein
MFTQAATTVKISRALKPEALKLEASSMMRRLVRTIASLSLLLLSASAAALGARVHVVGRVFYTERFGRWGGAMPTGDEQARWQRANAEGAKPKPFAGQRILLRAGRRNRDIKPVAEANSGSDGRVSLSLSPGDYCLVAESKRHLSQGGPNFDAACQERVFSECDAIWHVTGEGGQELTVSFVRSSYGPPPCYHGPSPPSARPQSP